MQQTLAFDVYGTLINTSGVFNSLELLIGEKAKPFMDTWRNKQLEYSFRRGLMKQYRDFSVCTADSLEFCCRMFKVELTGNQKKALLDEYSFLPIFADVVEGLSSLKEVGYALYAFSNGSRMAISRLLTNAGIMDRFDGIVSTDNLYIVLGKSIHPGIDHFFQHRFIMGWKSFQIPEIIIVDGCSSLYLQRIYLTGNIFHDTVYFDTVVFQPVVNGGSLSGVMLHSDDLADHKVFK